MRPWPQGGVAGGRGSDAGLTIVAAGLWARLGPQSPPPPSPHQGDNSQDPSHSTSVVRGSPPCTALDGRGGPPRLAAVLPGAHGVCVMGNTDGSTWPSSE